MVKNYLAVAFRTLLKERWFSIINIFGLALGLCAFWMIQHYVTFEKSYENFVESADDIYRVQLDVIRNGQLVFQSSENYPGVGPAMKEEFPEVLEYGRFYNMGSKNSVVIIREKGPNGPITLKQKRFLYADASVLSLLSYEMINGNREQALEKPFTMVISESTAKKYFGNENPIGQFLRLQDDDFNDELCQVTGVYKDSPKNTHLKFDVLISYETLYARDDGSGWTNIRYRNGWRRKDMYTYVKLSPGTDPNSLESKLPALVNKFKPQLQEQGGEDILKLQPISSIHLTSHLTDEAEVNGSDAVVFYLSIVSWFILVIAWVNYINLSTAKAVNRAKEVGLRKVMGSQKTQLISQFLVEAFLINAFSIIVAIGLLGLFMPLFNQLVGFTEAPAIWVQPWFWIAVGSLILGGTILSGLYPAFVLSSYDPLATIKGKFKNSEHGNFLRKSLVVTQFAASIGLIIGTFIIYHQMDLMLNKDLGFNADKVLVIQRPAVRDTARQVAINDYNSFRNNVRNLAEVKGFGAALVNPGTKLRFKTEIRLNEASPSESQSFAFNMMDYDYMEIMEMELAAGRMFSRDYSKDADTAIVINETGAKALGFSDPSMAIGKYVSLDDWEWKPQIVGVMKDYHQETLKEKIIPQFFILRDFGNEFYLVKLNTSELSSAVQSIEDQWAKSFHSNPMDYFFLDEYFNSYYRAEKQFQDMFLFFSILAIMVGCMGLFGLSLFTTIQRSKEIGIRKVLGASAGNIVRILVSDIMKLIIFANLIAWPIAYFVMKNWLENYPYHIEISWVLFVSSALIVIIIAMATVGLQTLKSAQTNPVDVLKYE